VTAVATSERLPVAGAVTFGGTVTNAALAFLMTGIISNALGTTSTGLFFQATALFAIIAAALGMGADTALVRSLSRARALDRPHVLIPTVVVAFVPVLVVSIVVATAVWLAAPTFAQIMNPAAPLEAQALIRGLAPFLPAAPMLGLTLGACRGLGRYLPYTALQSLLVPASRVVLLLVVLSTSRDVELVVLAWAAPLVLAVLLGVPVLVRLLRQMARTGNPIADTDASHRAVARPFWSFALPRGGSTLLERALDWSGVLIVIALAGPADGGVYAVVTRVASIGTLLEGAARVVTGPKISHALALGDLDAARAIFADVTRLLVLGSWPLYSLLIVFAAPVLSLFGPGFSSGAPALAAISVAMMTATAVGMLQSFLLMGGQSHWQLMNRGIQLLTLVGLCFLLVPRLGVLGAALAWVAAILVDALLAGTQVFRRMGVRSSPRLIAVPCLTVVGVFGVGGWLVRLALGETVTALVTSVLVCGAVYLAVCARWRRELGITALLGQQ